MGMVWRGTGFSFQGETGGIHSGVISFFVVLKMDSVLPKLFSGGKDLAKPRLHFPPAERGLGNECGRDSLSDFSATAMDKNLKKC